MILKDISLSTPEDNILFDDVLLKLAERAQGDDILRFWESPSYFVVLGLIGKAEQDIYVEAARKDGIPILRRSSGGGTVVQGPGCLNYSLILSKEKHTAIGHIRESYAYILEKVVQALHTLGVSAQFWPISDIALIQNQKKFSGNAQKRAKHYILHHGTILYDFDLSKIEKYLRMPQDTPAYRKGRPHHDFVTNVTCASVDIKNALAEIFHVSKIERGVTEEENRVLKTLRQERQVFV